MSLSRSVAPLVSLMCQSVGWTVYPLITCYGRWARARLSAGARPPPRRRYAGGGLRAELAGEPAIGRDAAPLVHAELFHRGLPRSPADLRRAFHRIINLRLPRVGVARVFAGVAQEIVAHRLAVGGEMELEGAEAGPAVARSLRLTIAAFLGQDARGHVRVDAILGRHRSSIAVNVLGADAGDRAAGSDLIRRSGRAPRLLGRRVGVWRVGVGRIVRVAGLALPAAHAAADERLRVVRVQRSTAEAGGAAVHVPAHLRMGIGPSAAPGGVLAAVEMAEAAEAVREPAASEMTAPAAAAHEHRQDHAGGFRQIGERGRLPGRDAGDVLNEP